MTRKRRLLWTWSIFGAVVLAASAAFAARALRGPGAAPSQGLVAGVTDERALSVPSRAPTPRFSRVPLPFRHFPAERTHRLPEDMGSGLAVADLDGDGRDDLVFAQETAFGAPQSPCVEVFRNASAPGSMRFERVETSAPPGMAMGIAAGDYDADDDLDLYVAGYGSNVLLRNDGGFRFADVTEAAGVAGGGFSAAACWGDADSDGDLDLYVARYVAYDPAVPATASKRGTQSLPASLNPSAFPALDNLLFLNDGAGRFVEAAAERKVANPGGKSLGAAFADFDGDGVQDLYVVNDVSDNAMLRGLRGGPFEDATYPSCTSDWRGAMGLAVGDPDRDGDLDLFITHWITEENTLFAREEGAFVFRDASLDTYLGPPGRGRVGWACDFGEIDNDGFPDLFVVNGSTFEESADTKRLVPQPLQLFWNGGERFFDLADRAGASLATPLVGRAGMVADLDGDGRQDWVVGVHGGEPLLLRNETEPAGRRLVVEARGRHPNPFAYGAVVTVESGGSRQAQAVGAKPSYLASGPPSLHFGLGATAKADRVVVRFPSGTVVERRDVPAGRVVVPEVDLRALGPRMDEVGDALREDRLDDARAALRAVLRENPDHPGALYRLASLTAPPESLSLLDRLARVEPGSARSHLLRAKALSDPRRPEAMDLDAALAAIRRAREVNPNETGVGLEEGRILLVAGRFAEAAAVLEQGTGNPRLAALAALARLRAGDEAAATRLLGRAPGHGVPHLDEGDTEERRTSDRDLVARLLDLGPDERWRMEALALDSGEGAPLALEDVDGDGALDVRVGSRAALLRGARARETVDAPGAAHGAGPPRPPAAPYDLEEAGAFALRPPEWVDRDPPGTTASAEADADGDGDLDRFVVCGGDDPASPLPWWLLRREGDRWRPVRGSLPSPGLRFYAVAAADLDGDGRAEAVLAGGGTLPGDRGRVWIASLRPPP